MKDFAPSYYDAFKCIADRCRHNCCIGWQIDIDSIALDRYASLGGALRERIIYGIEKDKDGVHFKLCENGRCPMLDSDNLCSIIKEKDDGYLCDICREHPRFYNFFDSRAEWGLGLCCEEAARIILSCDKPFSLCFKADDGKKEVDDDFENYILFMRDESIKILSQSEEKLSQRLETFLSFCEAKKPYTENKRLYDIFSSLERLDSSWSEKLEDLLKSENTDIDMLIDNKLYSKYFENLSVYLVYRHLSAAFYDGRVSQRAAFIYVCISLISKLCLAALSEKGIIVLDDIIEISRAFSCEIEYSDENIERLL